MVKRIGLVSASAIALAMAYPAFAQDAAAPASPANTKSPVAAAQDSGGKQDGLGEIVVTATRQATNLQNTPIAITAVTSGELESRGVTTVSDLTSVVPNAQFQKTQGAFGPGVSGTIRGIGSGDTNIGGENAIAYYIDDVYYPLVLGANFDLLDTDHIEVLRGPQGTLFGRNALAGAVNIVAKQPDPSGASAYVDVTTGSYNRIDVRAGFNMPLSSTAALRVSGLSKQRQGYMKMVDFTCDMQRRGTPQLAGSYPTSNVLKTNQPNFKPDSVNDCVTGHLGGEDVHGGRASLMWEPASSVRLTVTGDYIHDTSQNAPDTLVSIDPKRVSTNVATEAAYFGLTVDQRFKPESPFETYATYADAIPAGTVIPGNTYYTGTVVNGRPTRGGYSLDPHIRIINWGFSGKLNWDLGSDIALTAVVGHRELHEYHAWDTDGMPLVVEHTVNDNHERYWNAEVRLAGKMDWVDWVVGAFYFDAHGDQHAAIISPGAAGQRSLHTTYDPNSKAVFANATVRPFGDKLSFTGGLRYSDDHKVVDFSNLADISPVAGDLTFVVIPKQKQLDWKAGINYQATHNMLFYASAATGNSLPGYNARPQQATQIQQFSGQDVIAYEAGAKLDLFDRHVRFNGDVFYTDFKTRPSGLTGSEARLDPVTGLPVPGNQVLVPLPGGPAGSTQCGTTTVAAGTGITCIGRTYYRNLPASIKGAEAEVTINPVAGLLINGSVGYSKFWADDIAARTVNRRQGGPFWTANAGIQYRADDVLGGSMTPRLDWTYQSSQVYSGTSTATNYLGVARSLVNARLTYDNADHDFSIAVGATNLFNKFYYINVFDYQPLGYPQTDAQPGQPREWYLTVSKRF